MIFPNAHLRACAIAAALLAGAPAFGCGAFSSAGRIAEATEHAELKLEDGRTLRLAGLDAPQAELVLDRIAEAWTERGVKIALLAPAPDRWGRWLADVNGDDGASLSDDLLRDGLARVKPEFETRGCEAAAARDGKRGARGPPRALGRRRRYPSPRPTSQRSKRRTGASSSSRAPSNGSARAERGFILISAAREGLPSWRARKSEAAFQRRGIKLSALAGRAVRVRGYLDRRFGPRIEIVDPLMIELAEGM